MPTVVISRRRIADGSLPSVCLVCGSPAEHRLFAGVNSPSLAWLLFSPLLGLLAFWAYVMVPGHQSEPAKSGLPFCEQHGRYWPRRGCFIALGFVGLIAVCMAASTVSPDQTQNKEQQFHWLYGVAGFWMLLFFPAFLFVHLRAMRPTSSNRETLTLSGVHEKFVASLMASKEET